MKHEEGRQMKTKEEIQNKLETQLEKSKQLINKVLMASDSMTIIKNSSRIDKLAGSIDTLRWILEEKQ